MLTTIKLFGLILAGWLLHPAIASAQEELFQLYGDAALDELGYCVGGAGDVNADGFDDFIAGIPRSDGNGTDSGSVRVYSGRDGSPLYTFLGDSAGDWFGRSVSGAGDVNADGFDDVVVGAPFDDNHGSKSGSARVFSGADGSILYTFDGDSPLDELGWSVSKAGDVDLDGFDDVIVGARWDDSGGKDAGAAFVYSGRNGARLFTFHGDVELGWFGTSVSGGGDLDRDGHPDLVVGGYHFIEISGPALGCARAFSGANGSVLHRFDADTTGYIYGWSVASGGDVNGDGAADLILGSSPDTQNFYIRGAQVISGLNGEVIYNFDSLPLNVGFGTAVSGAGDVDGDGYHDFIVGASLSNHGFTDAGSVQVYSGLTGTVLYSFHGSAVEQRFGYSVAGAGDVNGDGYDDVIIGSVGDDSAAHDAGRADVISGKPFLFLSPHELSSALGGSVHLDLEFPVSEQGRSYALLGSLSGTEPTLVHGVEVPLTRDLFFRKMREGRPPSFFAATSGHLDANGRGSVDAVVPPGVTRRFLFREFWFAAVTRDAAGLRLSSQPVVLRIRL